MKPKIAVMVVLVCLLTAAGVLYGLSYVKVYQIISALQGQDRERLAEYVDFPQLRMGVKEQIRVAISTSIRNNVMEKMRQAVTSQVLDKAVDEIITPEGLPSLFHKNLAGLMRDRGNPANRKASLETYPTVKIFMAFFWQAHFAYASFAEFVITLKDQKEQSLRVLLRRTGLTWRLSRVEVPVPAESNEM